MSCPPRAFCLKSVYICIYFIIYTSIFCDCDAHTGGYIHRCEVETESSALSRCFWCATSHPDSSQLLSFSSSAPLVLGWRQEIQYSLPSTMAGVQKGDGGGSDLTLLRVDSGGPRGLMPLFTKTQLLANQRCPKYTHTQTHTRAHTHTKIPSSHCTARVKGLCAR